jgi:hypothetical protein
MIYLLSKKDETRSLIPVPLACLAQAGWQEKDLENELARNIRLVVPEADLMVVSQSRKWQEEADILALDAEGSLYIFEIKRVEADQSNLLQVMRYGQIFGQYDYENLRYVFRQYRRAPDADLAALHCAYFDLSECLSPAAFNRKQKFVVVTAGVHIRTLDAIRYWRERGVPIEAVTYHVYQQKEDFLVEFNGYSPDPEDYSALLSNDHVVNTNYTWDKTCYRDMLDNCRAAAYYYKGPTIDCIQHGDRVFLYHTGVGVIAAGTATTNPQIDEWEGTPGAQHYVGLHFELKADPDTERDKCVPAWEINQALGISHHFRQTRFAITREMADKIFELMRKRHHAAPANTK